MGARLHEQYTRLGEDEDEKEKTSFSSSSFDNTTTATEGRWRRRLPESRSGRATDAGTLQRTPPPRRRAPSANAHASMVQTAEEWATTVDTAAAWSDVVPADNTEAP